MTAARADAAARSASRRSSSRRSPPGRHEFGPLVGTRDMMVVHSVVDILGLNEIACTVFDNVVAAMAGMVRRPLRPRTRRQVHGAAHGGGHDAGQHHPGRDGLARRRWPRPGSRGADLPLQRRRRAGDGGARRARATSAASSTSRPTRSTTRWSAASTTAAPTGCAWSASWACPRSWCPAASTSRSSSRRRIPPALADRPSYDHNPEFRLVRTSPEEMLQIAGIFARAARRGQGPGARAHPDPRAVDPERPGRAVLGSRRPTPRSAPSCARELRSDIPVTTHDFHVNDPEFGRVVARSFLDLLQEAPA